MTSLKIGLIVNPIAGVGAALAWKGTDDVQNAWDAVNSGEVQPIWDVIVRAINSISKDKHIKWSLGDNNQFFPIGDIVYELPLRSTAEHTKEAVKRVLMTQPNLILFAGGDGTALDVADEAKGTPILGIPGGVKIFSPCFLHRPEDLGDFLRNWDGQSNQVDLLDLDEEEYRQGFAKAKLTGSAMIPISEKVQVGKVGSSGSDTSSYELIAERIKEEGWLHTVIAVGPGSTMQGIFRLLNIEKSLLGVDVIDNGQLVAKDCTAKQLELYKIHELWISPIGNQGHILGRGNRQISPKIIRTIGKENIRIFSTPDKMLETPKLYIDSGSNELDKQLRGYYHVIVGYYEEKIRKAI
ncbi:MAG: ATP-NAD kinase family protein [Candidatus Kariarchaeaceae archaeon]|jgi:predicted polyphosphate/ATP-dependent NAD kinase